MKTQNGITFPDRVVLLLLLFYVVLLLCGKSCPPRHQEKGLPAAAPGLGTTDAKLHCCCCWCSPVLLLMWFGHTHAHKNCASDLWVEGLDTYVEGDGRLRRP